MLSHCHECGALNPLKDDTILIGAPEVSAQSQWLPNESPRGPQVDFIRSAVSQTNVQLAYLDEEISQLRHRLKQLEEKRAELLDYRTRNVAVLSPLRRMPPELLAEIFSWTLPPPSPDLSGCAAVKHSPWILAQVSKYWRTVALSQPALWSLVYLDYTKFLAHLT
ncbi:hypothetical protein FB45DRAFT_748721 [Roridomyces roridus]|uniref:F-box domain-containing protein n=1 Tax=Roridomyces roridus TaxID=1738132 RepID=A0AAD7FJY9_9AGAR|nr:hypothetical protein FB45DRAFT_748721 [Roridomyces roridus]